MKHIQETQNRVLGIDPYSRGFGFAVLKGPYNLIDWGIKEIREEEKNTRCLAEVEALIDRYRPDIIAVEDYTAKGSRRCKRVRELIFEVLKLAMRRKIKIKTVSRARAQRAFSETGARTKHQIATVIAKRFPELGPYLPAERKCYMSEDPRMGVFDAVGLGLSFYRFHVSKKIRFELC
jgi:Holliday junction resolvasome RuvABC endonuclease subunit